MSELSIKERVWSGSIPICISVGDPVALGTHEYLLYARRISYLPLYTARVLEYFARYLEDGSKGKRKDEWWFEYNGTPLPWNRPIGLLYDSIVGLPTGEPWRIELKVGGTYPSDRILVLESDETLLNYWTNQFKESCYIRDGNARAVMLMSKEEQEMLWKTVMQSAEGPEFDEEREKFWSSVGPLIRKPTSEWNVPLRLYSDAFDEPVIQKLVVASVTLGEFLHETLPNLFFKADSVDTARPILHGAVVPLTAELGDLYTEAIYMDGFLHISILAS